MGCGVKDDIVYVEKGEALDIETIIRLRPWIEDITREKISFTKTNLITDYDRKREIFEFRIVFVR